MQQSKSISFARPHLQPILFSLLVLVCILASPYARATNSLDKKTLDAISASTFEVVIPKPVDRGITYEKELPYDLLPYSIRNDKYLSIGTAFAIGKDTFISASHVFTPELNKQTHKFYLRNKQGKLFALKKVTKLSTHKDFIVFSTKGLNVEHPLSINTKPTLNERVYAVGNANGQGVVIRDGLYTSNTPEELAGAWKWIRFSAAASPGNSGGPLLDKHGKVIGVVLRKSKNENLNYALPITEVLNTPKDQAEFKTKLAYSLENMDMVERGKIEYHVPLPMEFAALSRKFTAKFENYSQSLLDKLLENNRENIFPRGKGSEYLLHTSYSATSPRLIEKGQDSIWNTYRPSKLHNADLGNNGLIKHGSMDSTFYATVRKPDNVSRESFYHDPKLLMDLFLKGVPLYRSMGGDKIKLTSLGKPQIDEPFVDHYKRHWQVRVWHMNFSDERLIVFSLPTPQGNVLMIRRVYTAMMNSNIADLKTLTDFIYVSYYGTLAQWKEYLADTSMLPASLKSVDIDFEPGEDFHFRSKRVNFDYDHKLMKIDEDSDMLLGMSYYQDHGKVVWDVSSITVGENKDTGRYFEIFRNIRPTQSMSENDKRYWDKLVEGRIPYNESSFYKDENTYIGKVLSKKTGDNKLLFSLIYCDDGNKTQEVMKPKLEEFARHVNLKETG
jgi:hypothetical protein